MFSAALKGLLLVGSFLLKLLGDTITDPLIQHLAVVLIIGYSLLHGFSKAFRALVSKEVKGVESKTSGVILTVESPFLRVIHAVKGAISGFTTGLKAPVVPAPVPLIPPKVSPAPTEPPKAA